MSSRKGAPVFSSLMDKCVLWAPLSSSAVTNTGKTITTNGNVTQSTAVLDPWGLARPVGYFDGNGDYLSVPYHADFNFGTGDFTIEADVYLISFASTIFVFYIGVDTTRQLYLGISTAGSVSFYAQISGTKVAYYYTAVGEIVVGQWYHIVAERNGATVKIFINGNEISVTEGTAISTNSMPTFQSGDVNHIGKQGGAEAYANAYMSELRVSKGVARYTENFTPQTSRFKPDQYTKLLLHMYGSGATFVDDPFVDVNEFPIIPSGVTVTPNGTFYKQDLGNNTQVVKFDGSTNYLSLLDNATWDILDTEFTICGWIRLSTITPTYSVIIGQYESDTRRWHLRWINSNYWQLYSYYDSVVNIHYTVPYTLVAEIWYHVAFIRLGSSLLVYINGISITPTISQAFRNTSTFTATLQIGRAGIAYANGNIKDLMIFKGRALTQAEIKLLMNRTHPITGVGLLPGGYDYYRG